MDPLSPSHERRQPVTDAAISPGFSALRLLQLLTALWLLVAPLLYTGQWPALVVIKDVAAGGVLLSVTVGAAVTQRLRRAETGVCVALGVILVVASFVIDHAATRGPLLAQWSELLAGVLLVCIGAVRAR